MLTKYNEEKAHIAEIFEEKLPEDLEIVFFAEDSYGYEGECYGLAKQDGKLYTFSGSHCSCMGFEEQFALDEQLGPALYLRTIEQFTGFPFNRYYKEIEEAVCQAFDLVKEEEEVAA